MSNAAECAAIASWSVKQIDVDGTEAAGMALLALGAAVVTFRWDVSERPGFLTMQQA